MALPIVAFGKTTAIAKAFMASILPEYEMIHFVNTVEDGKVVMPLLLQGQQAPPNDATENVGTKNYAQPPVAVMFGGAFGEDAAQEVREACQGLTGIKWLVMDQSKERAAVGPGYGEHIAQRIKECLTRLREEGKLEGDGLAKY